MFRVRVGKYGDRREAETVARGWKRKNSSSPGSRAELLSSVLSGALLALSFPRYGHPAFAWVALVPLLLALSGWTGQPGPLPGQPLRRAFWLGLMTGLVYFAGTVYWTSSVLAVFGGMPMILAVVAMLLLAAYLAIYPAVTAMVLA